MAEEDEASERERVQEDGGRLRPARDEDRQADEKTLQGTGDLALRLNLVGTEEGPLPGREELEPQEVDLNGVAREQLEAQAVVDSEAEQAEQQ